METLDALTIIYAFMFVVSQVTCVGARDAMSSSVASTHPFSTYEIVSDPPQFDGHALLTLTILMNLGTDRGKSCD